MEEAHSLRERLEEMEEAATVALHVNQALNGEIEKLFRAYGACQAENRTLRARADWLAKQLVKANRQLRVQAKAPGADEFDEAQAMLELLEQMHAEGVPDNPDSDKQDRNNQAATASPAQQKDGLQSPSTPDAEHEPVSLNQHTSMQVDEPVEPPQKEVQLSSTQKQYLQRLKTKGASEGWLINPDEVAMGRLLGKGEFGITYQATWRGATVAVKCVQVKSQKVLITFLREVEALCNLRHPNVLPFLGACLHPPNKCWLLTEYMDGGTLAEWLHPHMYTDGQRSQDGAPPPCAAVPPPRSNSLARSSMPVTRQDLGQPNKTAPLGAARSKPLMECVRVMYEVAQGLQALESLQPPLVHRDIKPHNIFMEKSGRARVGDFGLSRRLLPEAAADLTGETGSYLYMAPEVMRHEIYDNKADVWSWGVMFVEGLSLQVPYSSTFLLPQQVALGVAEEELAPEIPPNIPADLKALARFALAFNPEDRAPFSFLTAQLSSVLSKMQQEDQAAGESAQGPPPKEQLNKTWAAMLKRLYVPAGAKQHE